MKKYIIVSIIVATLFIGGSIFVAKAALTTTTNIAKSALTMKTFNFVEQLFIKLKTSQNITIKNETSFKADLLNALSSGGWVIPTEGGNSLYTAYNCYLMQGGQPTLVGAVFAPDINTASNMCVALVQKFYAKSANTIGNIGGNGGLLGTYYYACAGINASNQIVQWTTSSESPDAIAACKESAPPGVSM